ncbi:MAG: hypothetical protein KatS3mg110_0705 [Pirellulaceae bacterium]|nr:MAG: hypothetical protein KatS3mg110_0705 [Pirellulaceae bacterium]
MIGLWNWFFVFAAVQDVTASNEIERVLEIERRAVAAREAIERGEYRIIAKTLDRSGTVINETEYWIVFDTNRLRVDQRYRIHGSGIPVKEQFVVDQGKYIQFHKHLGTSFATVVEINWLKTLSPFSSALLLEPRSVGMMPLPLTSRIPLNACVAATSNTSWERKSARMFYGSVDGHEAIVTEHMLAGIKTPLDAVRTIWIVPDLGYSVVKMEFRTISAQPLLDRLENKIRAYEGEKGTVWFPEWVRTERYVSGEYSHAFTAQICDAKFNKPIDGNLFTLAGLDLPEGASVHDHTAGRYYRWDGKQLVERYVGDRWWAEEQAKLKALGDKASSVWESAELPKVFTESAPARPYAHWLWWCAAGALTLLGIVCVGIGVRRWIYRHPGAG